MIAALEVLRLDESLLDQSLEAVIGLAQADPEPARQITLGELRVFLNQPHDAEMDFVVAHRRNLSVSGGRVQSMNASISQSGATAKSMP